ncbi:hypothetical protein EYC84_000090 [Monilinia fructicola]|uniref:Uncharacterized protein n=1 Tax=Monilinia fructicola TaxID=38448 RepID=A0A5M9JSB5_MONFR|nr:hypothetical protein EYC84_000090 [Monilinia fructicola]
MKDVHPIWQPAAHGHEADGPDDIEGGAQGERDFQVAGPGYEEAGEGADGAGGDGRDDETEAGGGGGFEEHGLEVEGDVEDDGVDDEGAERVGDDEGGARFAGYEGEGHDGLGGVVLDVDEEGETEDDTQRLPQTLLPPIQTQVAWDDQPRDDETQDQTGNLHAKLPPPPKVIRDGTPESGARGSPNSKDDVEIRLVGAPDLDGDQITGNDGAHRHDAPGAQPTHGSGHDKARHALGERAPDGRDEKQHHGEQVRGLPAHGVREPAEHGLEAGRREEEGRGEPRRAVGRVEIRRDDRVAGDHDGRVERGERVGQQHAGEDEPEPLHAHAAEERTLGFAAAVVVVFDGLSDAPDGARAGFPPGAAMAGVARSSAGVRVVDA